MYTSEIKLQSLPPETWGSAATSLLYLPLLLIRKRSLLWEPWGLYLLVLLLDPTREPEFRGWDLSLCPKPS